MSLNNFTKKFAGVCVITVMIGCSLLHAQEKSSLNIENFQQNPCLQLMAVLQNFRDSTDSFNDIEIKLDQIQPVECMVDNIRISAVEMNFLLQVFKLDFAVTLKEGEKSLKTSRLLKEIMSHGNVDYKKLNKIFCDIDFEFVAEFDIFTAYVLCNNGDEVLESVQKSLQRYNKGSYEYTMLRFTLGLAFLKNGHVKLSIEPMAEAFKYFNEHGPKVYEALAASNLCLAYSLLGDDKKRDKYRKIADGLAQTTNSGMVKCELHLEKMLKLLDEKKWTTESKTEFNASRSFVLQKSTSDLQIWSAYIFSALIKIRHDYPDSEVLPDLEKAYMYRWMIWGNEKVNNSLKQLDDMLEAMKSELLQRLAKSSSPEQLHFWTLKFEQVKQRNVVSSAMVDNLESQKMQPFFALISRYENANQIVELELVKPEEKQDKLLLQKALYIKRDLEKRFEQAKKSFSVKDRKMFNALLADNFIIHPDSLGQLGEILDKGVACIQFLPVGENIVAMIVVKNSPAFLTTIPLQAYGLNSKILTKKLIKLRYLIKNKASVDDVEKEAQKLYSILFSDIEKALKKMDISKIVINASGILRYIPFAVLYDGKKYLIEKYQATNITGLDLIRLSKNSGTKTISNVKAAIFADPDGSLPAGRKEGLNIAQFFENKKLYLGDKASLAEFESMVGNVNFVHLATHAVLDPNEPGKSYIQFADGKKWYYSDMMGFNIQNVDSIALSACETAVSEKSTGGEIESMAYQLLKKSPSGSVLASFWKVDDTATAMLMGIYYKHVTDSIKTNHTLDRGGALREAQLNLLKNPDTSHPYYWAAFTLFGDFR